MSAPSSSIYSICESYELVYSICDRLVIRGKFVPKYIESLLRKYIGEYVACQMCRSFNTALTRDSVSRLFFVSCQDCGSSRSVAQIKAGYHAQTRADRRAIRNNAA